MKFSRWAFLFLVASVGLFGQRADAMRTPLADVRSAITQPHQITATTAELQADEWLVESITPLGLTDDGQLIALISLLVPLSSLDELTPASTRAGPYAAPKTHTRVFCIVQPPLGLAPSVKWTNLPNKLPASLDECLINLDGTPRYGNDYLTREKAIADGIQLGKELIDYDAYKGTIDIWDQAAWNEKILLGVGLACMAIDTGADVVSFGAKPVAEAGVKRFVKNTIGFFAERKGKREVTERVVKQFAEEGSTKFLKRLDDVPAPRNGTYQVGRHGDMPSPRPAGHQSHHGVNSVWTEANVPGSKAADAPAVLMPNAPDHNATRGGFNRWRAEIARRQGVSPRNVDWEKVSPGEAWRLAEEQFQATSAPAEVVEEYFRQFNNYVEGLK